MRAKRVWIAAITAWLTGSAGIALGQSESAPNPQKKPIPGPKYLDLRYNEDFSYLDGEPGSYHEDFFDPIKNIHLDNDWRLTLGGEFRFRLEAEDDKAFGATDPSQDTFGLFRYLLHADLRYRDSFRVFAQLIAAFDENRDLAPRGTDENYWELQQLFFDVKLFDEGQPWTLRVGRQELLYGNQRLVSPLDWANTRRRFDGVKLFTSTEKWDLDLWWVRPVPVQRKQRDRYNEDVDFYGAYATYKGIPRHGLDLYFLALINSGSPGNPNGKSGDMDVYMLGTRFWGKTGPWDYETELAGQWGHWAGDTIQAWSWAVDGGYTFKKNAWTPRVGAGFDIATGDRRGTDGSVQTFNQFFPLGHKYFGYMDLIGRQNITAANVNISAWPVPKKVRAAIAFHSFWLTSRKDFLYNAGGGPSRRDATGGSGREIGQELDLTLLWKMNLHASMLFGYSHFWDGGFIQDTGPSDDVDFFYVQYKYKF